MNKETLTQSGVAWRAGRLQRGSVASPSCQNKVITAGGRRDGVVSGILEGFLRHLCRARLLEIRLIQGLVTLLGIEEHAGVGTFCNSTCALAKLGLVESIQPTLAKML
jgi:hypothetical protein